MKCAIYPYSDELYPVIENRQMTVDDIDIDTVIYPRAWSKTIVHTEALKDISSGTDFEELTANCECVIFADVTDKDFMYSDILKKAELSLSAGKSVIFCTKLRTADLDSLRKKYPERRIVLKYGTAIDTSDIYKHEDINCAAFGIGSLYRGLDNVAAVTRMSAQFKKKGLRTVTVAVNATCSLLGFYHFPGEILNGNLDIEQKVGALNAFFKKLEQVTRCDIMIVQFPDGMMKFIDEVADSYGVKAFMLTRAVAIDYFLLVSLLEIRSKDSYELISSVMSKRFGLSLDSCLVQDIMIDRESSIENEKIRYTKNGVSNAKKSLEDMVNTSSGIIISELDDLSAYERIAEDCIKKLS